MEGNLTKGPILKTLTKLAIPIMASSFLGTLYNITDMAWIGLLGSKAVAGVGVGGMFTWLSQGLLLWRGWAVRCRLHSALDVVTGKGAWFCTGSSAAGSGDGNGVCDSFTGIYEADGRLFQLTDAEAYAAAMSHTRIACGLIVFSFMTLTLTGLYTAQGDSKTPFLANLIGLVTT